MENLLFEIHPVGWPDTSRYDIIAKTSDGKRYYLIYACCRYHAQVIIQLISNSGNSNISGVIAGVIRKRMNIIFLRNAEADRLICKALAATD